MKHMSKKTRFKKYLKKYKDHTYKQKDLVIGYAPSGFYPFIIDVIDTSNNKVVGFYSTLLPVQSIRGTRLYTNKCVPYNKETKSLLN